MGQPSKSRSRFIIPPISLDKSSSVPMRQQLRKQLATVIQNGTAPRGARIPSTRLMAKLLQVSRNTVLAAYDDLVADGLLAPEPGAGMRVSSAAPARGPTLFGLRHVIRAAHYPARVLSFADPDGNPLYLNMK